MNLNKEERLEQIRNILIGSQIGDLAEKVTFLENNLADEGLKEQFEKNIADLQGYIKEELSSFKQLFGLEQTKHEKTTEQLQQLQTTSEELNIKLSELEKKGITNEDLRKQFEERVNDLEKFIYEEINSFKQLFGLAQTKHEKTTERLQQLQTTSKELNIKLSKLEKKFEQSQNSLEHSSELAEIKEQLKLLQLGFSSQEIKNKNAYEQSNNSLQEYTRQWDLQLLELEQKTFKRDQVLQKYLLEHSKRSSNKLAELREEMLESNKEQKTYFLAQLKLIVSEIKRLENERLESEPPKHSSSELHSYREISHKKLAEKHPLILRLWGWIRLNGRKRKENHF